MTPVLLLVLCPWSWCQPSEPRTNEVVRSFDLAAPSWGIASFPGGLIAEPVRTAYPKLSCDWTDREAQSFIHWRDFELHGAHEDRDGLFCESNLLWKTWLMGRGDTAPGSGFLVTKYGAGAYLGRVCRALAPSDTTAAECDESKERGTSACVPRRNFFSFPEGVPTIKCVSTDPKGCL